MFTTDLCIIGIQHSRRAVVSYKGNYVHVTLVKYLV